MVLAHLEHDDEFLTRAAVWGSRRRVRTLACSGEPAGCVFAG